MKVFAVVAFAVVVLLLAGGRVEVRWWTSSGSSNVLAANEVVRIVDARSGAHLDASFQNLYAIIRRVNLKTPAGMSVLEHEVPGVAARIAEESDAGRAQLAALDPKTATGRRLRAVMLRGLLAQRLMYDDLAAGSANPRTARPSFKRWVKRYKELHCWFVVQVHAVVRTHPTKTAQP
jgi:hypothetical protein